MTRARTETITVRLDPKLRYLAGVGARRFRYTMSSFIEWAISLSVGDEFVGLWDPEPADRFARLAFRRPDLLIYPEELLWKRLRENPALWLGDERTEGSLNRPAFREAYATAMRGDASEAPA